jgi:hypothetical protein
MSIELYLSQNRIADLEAQVSKLHGLMNYAISIFPDNEETIKNQLKKLLGNIMYATHTNHVPNVVISQPNGPQIVNENELFNADELVFSAINIISDEPMTVEELYEDSQEEDVEDKYPLFYAWHSQESTKMQNYLNSIKFEKCTMECTVECPVECPKENTKYCIGCIENQPNQQAHMDIGGCLYEEYEYSDEESSNDNSVECLAETQSECTVKCHTERAKYCIGCIENQPNQQAHMDIGGCLYEEYEYSDEESIKSSDEESTEEMNESLYEK